MSHPEAGSEVEAKARAETLREVAAWHVAQAHALTTHHTLATGDASLQAALHAACADRFNAIAEATCHNS